MNEKQVQTVEVIGKRFHERREDDFLGFETDAYAHYMTYEQIKPLLKEGATKESWGEVTVLKREELLQEMREYIPFAFGKAYGERGISAGRSVQHFIAWTWLIGDDEFSQEVEEEYNRNFHSYGLPILIKICKHYGFDIPED